MAEKELLIKIGQSGAERVQDALGKLDGGMKGLAKTAAGMAAGYFSAQGVINALKYSIEQSRQGEAAAVKLSTAYGRNTKALIDFANQRQRMTKFDDDGTVAAMAAIAAFTKQEAAVKALTVSAQDLATAKGMDLVAAAELLAKTFGSETNALKRSGIEVDAAAGSMERLEQITSGVAKLYGGQASAATETLAGAMAQAKNAIDNTAQAIGDQMNPAIKTGAGFLRFAAEKMSRFIESMDTVTIDDTAEAIGRLSGRTSGLVAVQREQARLKIAETQQELNDAMEEYGQRIPNAASANATLAKIETDILNLHLSIAESIREQNSGVSGKGFWYDWKGEQKKAREAIKTFERHKANLIPVISLYEELDALKEATVQGPTGITMEVTALAASVDDANKKLETHNKLMAAASVNYQIGAKKIFIHRTSQELFNDAVAENYISMKESIQQDQAAALARDLWISDNEELAKSLGMLTSADQKAAAAKQLLFNAQQAVAGTTSSSIGAIEKANTALQGSALVSKRLAQMQATVDTYASANAAFKSTAEIPIVGPALAPVAAAAAIVAGLANVAMIEKQQFASGGYVRGHGGGRSDLVPANLSAGEGVLTASTVARIGGEAAVNALNAGAGTGGGIVINFTGPVTDRAFVRDFIVPEVRRAVGRGMA